MRQVAAFGNPLPQATTGGRGLRNKKKKEIYDILSNIANLLTLSVINTSQGTLPTFSVDE